MSDSEVTPVERPARNPRNAPIVMSLFYLGAELRRSSDAIKDLARTIQLAEEEFDDVSRKRSAQVLTEIGAVVLDVAAEVAVK